MLQNIPTHVIAGPLGAGKTSLIRQLMAQRPANERWAVLVNEFGQVGLDAALLSRDEDGIAIGEVAGGCLCCVNGTPFQVGLGRLLRKARPDRLFIEPSGLGHPVQLLNQLQQAPWVGVLAVQPLVMVLDAQALARGEPLPEAQQQALQAAALVLLNKADAVDEDIKLLINKDFLNIHKVWTRQGLVELNMLPVSSTSQISDSSVNSLPEASLSTAPSALWIDPSLPICSAQEGEGGWSIGWRWHPSQRFEPQRLQAFLGAWPWRRAKGVIHSVDGWQSFNGLEGDLPQWQPSGWRKDSRIELIFEQAQPEPLLKAALAKCLI
ncbi:cobalamin biosynthesis protein CobW [Pseudomonas putida]|uniref:Cobalamin biosynthesis protein CobW n=1 Tax=Pseudomonas putida TaxID=303 RepID=A0A2S3WU53_PSEPU|nr:CobW family GTP-binding protein [Pseudomonas putida]POG04948.1 cobalamin biosynthesis protein CobW [Pseudomonas putida]POG07682.1 cobalamin biosynthesis protein CobW [Pseudomonas putida]